MSSCARPMTIAVVVMIALAPAASAGENPVSTGCGKDEEDLVVVVGGDNPMHDISALQLRRIFLGERVRIGDVRIVPINRPAGVPERTVFDHVVLGKSPAQVGQYWVNRKIRGSGNPPRSVSSVKVLRNIVARFPGAISYLRRRELSEGVRPVRIDGRSFCVPGYLFAGTKR